MARGGGGGRGGGEAGCGGRQVRVATRGDRGGGGCSGGVIRGGRPSEEHEALLLVPGGAVCSLLTRSCGCGCGCAFFGCDRGKAQNLDAGTTGWNVCFLLFGLL